MSKAPVNDFEDAISNFSSDNELEEDLLPHQGAEMNLATQVAFWNKETLVSCICGALPDSYCTCLPTSLDFAPDNDYFEHQPLQNQTHNSHHSDRFSSSSTTSDPQVSRLSGKTPAPTRKERRRQQNRAAQVRHRDKRNRFLHDTLHNIEALNEELKQTRAQRDYFRLMYEDLETQMMQLRSQSNANSRVPSRSPGQR